MVNERAWLFICAAVYNIREYLDTYIYCSIARQKWLRALALRATCKYCAK